MVSNRLLFRLDLDIAEKVIELTEKEVPRKTIARELGVTKDTVYAHQKRLNLII